jgi:hypothetical protein
MTFTATVSVATADVVHLTVNAVTVTAIITVT